ALGLLHASAINVLAIIDSRSSTRGHRLAVIDSPSSTRDHRFTIIDSRSSIRDHRTALLTRSRAAVVVCDHQRRASPGKRAPLTGLAPTAFAHVGPPHRQWGSPPPSVSSPDRFLTHLCRKDTLHLERGRLAHVDDGST